MPKFENVSHAYIQHVSSPDFQGRNDLSRRNIDVGLVHLRGTSREHRDAVPRDTRHRVKYSSRPFPVRNAAEAGNHVAVRSLLDHGHDVSLGDPLGDPLERSLRHRLVVNELLKRGAVPHLQTFRTAATIGNLETFRALARAYPGLRGSPTNNEMFLRYPMKDAARRGHGAIVAEIIDRYHVPADPSNQSIESALHTATGSAVNVLLNRGASIHRVSHLMSSLTPLEMAARSNDADKVRKLIRAGASPNYLGAQGRPVAFWAVRSGSVDALRALLELGADVNAVYDHRTLLTHAFDISYSVPTERFLEFIKLLVEYGIDVNFAPPGTEPPIIRAIRDSCDSFKAIVKAGADINVQYNGKSALHYAVEHGQKCKVELLLKKKVARVPDAHGRLASQYQMIPKLAETFRKYRA